ncbi:uncharacterized protein Z520_06013 [Fonsecaea multimorphosa CBS 102226]|uniref:Inositol polyphosphate-related phosphatase domain-containing protein n=1 Tax=Fonsecaea multimorphosa CBS 102226 TaxID=1442371 RepID=A0A0D2H7Z0_9EURO|nr:uncharacterized protein Z520_06013 [Fonsecaea multimorphosa CBS 102226]KIX97935.1 hypothetical protein Z520_06013 [Fonsecaea multimorphosa CBS 102226]OAL24308.1 hypothetical protein AYO22_05684 [Fonsecaea multimorphosa]
MANQTNSDNDDCLNIYILTYNCARTLINPATFAPYLFHALPPNSDAPELLVLCLQELAPISYSFLGGSFLTPYFKAFREAVRLASKDRGGYVNVVSRNLGMTAIMVFLRDDVADNLTWIRTAGVGVGVSEMGNKGAVGVQLGYRATRRHPPSADGEVGDESGELEFTFVSAHLAPMEDGLERRNEDYRNIMQKLVFRTDQRLKAPLPRGEEGEDAPLLQGELASQEHETLGEEETGMYSASSYLFFAGDLNYRTSLLQPSPQDVEEKFPQPSTNSNDPMPFRDLLAEDQLTQQVKAGKTLHGLTEAPITFPPTYKYHTDGSKAVLMVNGEDRQHWSWARHRWPSWCDRIFFSNPQGGDVKVTPQRYTSLPLFATSDHRPVALAASVPLKAVSNAGQVEGERGPTAPFGIDPDWTSKRIQARRKELAVGIMAYLALTWEGNGLLVTTTIGVVGAWLIIRSLLMG